MAITAMMKQYISADKALVFRITHRDNLPWILEHGLHCRNSAIQDPSFVQIGNGDLIETRRHRSVPAAPGGTLADYIPFYFTPRSPMFMNIATGWNGIRQWPNEEIVVMVTSIATLRGVGASFLFTDRHASLIAAQFSADEHDLDWIDWEILRNSDFKSDAEDPTKRERYEAECLVHQSLAVNGLLGFGTVNSISADAVKALLAQSGVALPIAVRPKWYF